MARISSPLTPQPTLPPDTPFASRQQSTPKDLRFPNPLHHSQSINFHTTSPHHAANSHGSSSSSLGQSPFKEPFRDSPSPSELETKYVKAVRELGRLQNEVSFLKGVMGTAGSDTNPRPVYLVPSELFYALKDILFRCFAAIESNVTLLGQEGQGLAQRYSTLKERASAYLHSNTQITTGLLMEMLEVLAAAEDVQRELTKVNQAEVDKLSEEMSELLSESYKLLIPIAAKTARGFDPDEMAIWNERRLALTKENASISLISLKKNLLSDFELLKQQILSQVLSITEFQAAEKPHFHSTSKWHSKFSATRVPPAQPSSEEIRFNLKRGLSDLFESLNSAKSEVGKWSWKEAPLKPGFTPKLDLTSDIDIAVKLARNEVEEITKVVVAEREAIEATMFGSANLQKVRELESGMSSLMVESDILKAKVLDSGTEINALKASLARARSELHQFEEKNRSIPSPDKASNSDLVHENDLLHAEISELKHSLHRQTTELKAILSRINASCDLPATTSISDLERHITTLSDYYNGNKEIELMESHEAAMVRGYHAAKFLSSYGFNESNVNLGMKYLIEKTEMLVMMLIEDYEGFERNENTSMQDLQRKEYELLDRIATEIKKFKTMKTPMEAEIGLLKRKNHELSEENKSLKQALKNLKDERIAEENELSVKQEMLEKSIAEMNKEITHLNNTVFQLKANLDITEVQIDFNLPQFDLAEFQSSRLKTDDSVEERLLKGFDLIIGRILQIGIASEELPEGILDKQKFVYEKLDILSEMLTTERNRAAAAESATEIAKSETQQYYDLYLTQNQQLTALQEKCAVLEQSTAATPPIPDTLGPETEVKIQEIADFAAANVASRIDTLLDKVSQANAKLADYVATHRDKQNYSQELATLQLQVETLKEERAFLFSQLQISEITYTEPSEENPVPFGSTTSERVSAILDESIRKTAAILAYEPLIPETIIDKLRALFDSFAAISLKSATDLQTYTSEIADLQSENASLSEQLALTEVSIQLVDPPLEVIECAEEHAATEDNLTIGFNFSIEKIAKLLQVECSPPEHLLEKQRYLYDLILQLSEVYDQTSLELAAAKQRLAELDQSPASEALIIDLQVTPEEQTAPIPGLRLYSQVFKGNEYLIEKAARALEKVPFCPQTLLDQQMCLHDLLEKMCEVVRSAKEKKILLKDAGNAYRTMYGDKGILEKLFWL